MENIHGLLNYIVWIRTMAGENKQKYSLYLIQRGTFKNLPKKDSERPFRGVIDYDYMGSAEFEFGSVNRSFNRMIRAYRDDRLKHITSSIKSINDVPLQMIYIGHYDSEDSKLVKSYDHVNKVIGGYDPTYPQFDIVEYINEVKRYIEGNDPTKIATYILKEHISLHHRCYKYYQNYERREYLEEEIYAIKHRTQPYHHKKDDFWFDISNDVMMFFSAQDRVDLIMGEFSKYLSKDE